MTKDSDDWIGSGLSLTEYENDYFPHQGRKDFNVLYIFNFFDKIYMRISRHFEYDPKFSILVIRNQCI